MASGFFAVLDDIAVLMDDVAINAKVATKKAAGILGDDLAVNAEKSIGFVSSRELPVLWAITKGSFLNKLIIVPLTLLLNAFFPKAITLVLILGGLYLAFEGVEKIVEYFFHKKESKENNKKVENNQNSPSEKQKIKSAITTDFILSVEIIIIALSTVLDKPLNIQILTLIVVSILATVGVYGIVALIVRMDDLGYLMLSKSQNNRFLTSIGKLLVNALPLIIRVLTVVGTLALLLVSGGIFSHNIEFLHSIMHHWPTILKDFILGIIGGLLALALYKLLKFIISIFRK